RAFQLREGEDGGGGSADLALEIVAARVGAGGVGGVEIAQQFQGQVRIEGMIDVIEVPARLLAVEAPPGGGGVFVAIDGVEDDVGDLAQVAAVAVSVYVVYSCAVAAEEQPFSVGGPCRVAIESAVVGDVLEAGAVALGDLHIPGAVAVVQEGDARAVGRDARA